jgi:hypothetical protein
MTAMNEHSEIDTARALATAVTREVAAGWRVESQTPTNAVLVKGKQTSHVLHLILSFITFGLWVPVWIIMAVLNRRQAITLAVDPYGNIQRQAV